MTIATRRGVPTLSALIEGLRPKPTPAAAPTTAAAPEGPPGEWCPSSYPDILSALAGMPTAMPTVLELAGRLRLAPGPAEVKRLTRALRRMERAGILESWPDPDTPHVTRIMISAHAAGRLGLSLAACGRRWETAGWAGATRWMYRTDKAIGRGGDPFENPFDFDV
jgi:hypothetical protein